MGGLEKFSDDLNKAVTGTSTPDQLAGSLSTAIMGWLSGPVYSVVTMVLIFVVVLFIFYGSFLYLTAYGDENRATLGKKTLTYAFVGLAISLLAFGIASYARAILVSKDYANQVVPSPQPVKAPVGDTNIQDQPGKNLF